MYISQAKDEEHSLGKKTLQRKSCEEIRNLNYTMTRDQWGYILFVIRPFEDSNSWCKNYLLEWKRCQFKDNRKNFPQNLVLVSKASSELNQPTVSFSQKSARSCKVKLHYYTFPVAVEPVNDIFATMSLPRSASVT